MLDHLKDWDLYADGLIYAYKNQVPDATGCTTTEPVLSRYTHHLAMEKYTPSQIEARTARQQWLSQLDYQMGCIRLTLHKAKSSYKATSTGVSTNVINNSRLETTPSSE